MSAKLIKVKLADGRFLTVDGELRRPGDVIEVTAADAKTLIDAGDAEKAKG